MTKQKIPLREVALVSIPLIIIVPIVLFQNIKLEVFSPFYWATQKSRKEGCQNNLKNISMAIKLYTTDNDGKMPSNGMAPTSGWAVTLHPYLKSVGPLQCPSEPTTSTSIPSRRDYTDFWFNSNLFGHTHQEISLPSSTLLLGEGNDGVDASNGSYSKKSLPSQWLSDPHSPAFRHLNGANYVMADGTVHWLKPDEVMTFGGRTDAFAVR